MLFKPRNLKKRCTQSLSKESLFNDRDISYFNGLKGFRSGQNDKAATKPCLEFLKNLSPSNKSSRNFCANEWLLSYFIGGRTGMKFESVCYPVLLVNALSTKCNYLVTTRIRGCWCKTIIRL